MTADLLPCPFCCEGKTASTYFDHEQGDKWGYASCDACGARGPEVRTNYDRDDNAPWRAEAITAWNRRALPALAPQPAPEPRDVREAARMLLNDLARALDTDLSEEGRKAGKRWSKASDAAEAAPTAMSRPTPIQMIRAALQSLALIGEPRT